MRAGCWPTPVSRSTTASIRSPPGSSSSPPTWPGWPRPGWELAEHEAPQAARGHLQKAGIDFPKGTADELAERRVQELVRFEDPRHHPLAFLPMPNPARCVHIMLEVEQLDDERWVARESTAVSYWGHDFSRGA